MDNNGSKNFRQKVFAIFMFDDVCKGFWQVTQNLNLLWWQVLQPQDLALSSFLFKGFLLCCYKREEVGPVRECDVALGQCVSLGHMQKAHCVNIRQLITIAIDSKAVQRMAATLAFRSWSKYQVSEGL